MSGAQIVAIATVLGSLVLLSQSSALSRLGLSKKVILGLVWVAIIVVVTAIIAQIIGPDGRSI